MSTLAQFNAPHLLIIYAQFHPEDVQQIAVDYGEFVDVVARMN